MAIVRKIMNIVIIGMGITAANTTTIDPLIITGATILALVINGILSHVLSIAFVAATIIACLAYSGHLT